MITRRFLLSSTVIVPLGACSTLQNTDWDKIAAVASADANAVASLLANALKQLAAFQVPGVTSDMLTIAQTSLSGVQSTAQAIAGAGSMAAAQPLVMKLATYASAALGAVSAVPGLPPQIAAILAGASLLVTVTASIVQIVVPQPPVPANAPAITVDQARQLAVPTS